MAANTVYFSLLFIDSMNTQVHETTGSTPYESVFGQKPSCFFPTDKSSGVIMKEDLEANGVHFELGENTDQDSSCDKV